MAPKLPSKDFIDFTSEKNPSLDCQCPLCVSAENVSHHSSLGQTTHDPSPGRTREFWRWDKSHSRLVLKRRSSDSIDSVKSSSIPGVTPASSFISALPLNPSSESSTCQFFTQLMTILRTSTLRVGICPALTSFLPPSLVNLSPHDISSSSSISSEGEEGSDVMDDVSPLPSPTSMHLFPPVQFNLPAVNSTPDDNPWDLTAEDWKILPDLSDYGIDVVDYDSEDEYDEVEISRHDPYFGAARLHALLHQSFPPETILPRQTQSLEVRETHYDQPLERDLWNVHVLTSIPECEEEELEQYAVQKQG